MAQSLPFAVRGRRAPGAGFLLRTARRTLVESVYLLTAPVTAVAGLLLALVGVGLGTLASLVPGGSPVAAGALAPARWSADLERWRIVKVRSAAGRVEVAGRRPRAKKTAAVSDPGLWLDVTHAVAVLPVVLVTTVVTGLWWFIGVAFVTFPLRSAPGTIRPGVMSVGSA